MAELPAFKFSRNIVLNGLSVLAIFLSGYFLYLLSNSNIGIELRLGVEIIELLLIILSFGILVITAAVLFTGRLSLKTGGGIVGNNKYLGYALHAIIGVSALFIILYKLNLYNYDILFQICFFIIIIFAISFAYYHFFHKIYEKDQSVLVIEPPNLKNSIMVDNEEELKKIMSDEDIKHRYEGTKKTKNIIYFTRNYNLIGKKYHYIEKKKSEKKEKK